LDSRQRPLYDEPSFIPLADPTVEEYLPMNLRLKYTRLLTGIALLLASSLLSAAEHQTELLWPHGAPGAKGDAAQDKPSLTICLPAEGKANGAAVVICPGGGYGGLAMSYEGIDVGDWFSKQGITAFVLKYRLNGQGGYQHPIPMHDAQRAMRFVRSHAADWKLDPHKIGIMGFSAGGHLAATVGTHFDAGDPQAADPIDRASCRPDFMILCYGVISMNDAYTHQGSKHNLLGDKPDPKLVENLSNETQVTAETPPTFLFHTNADNAVPAENSVYFYLALRKAKVPAELHIYETGNHGVGLAPKDPILSSWPARLSDWLKVRGLLK
jgi:acetyl esterase/lipase